MNTALRNASRIKTRNIFPVPGLVCTSVQILLHNALVFHCQKNLGFDFGTPVNFVITIYVTLQEVISGLVVNHLK